MIRMLVVGYVFAIRSERPICREVQVNLAYRWFCKLGIEDAIPDHSAFSRARNGRFPEGDIFSSRVRAGRRGVDRGWSGWRRIFAVDASLIQVDANKQRSVAGQDWRPMRCASDSRLGRRPRGYGPSSGDLACRWSALTRAMPKQCLRCRSTRATATMLLGSPVSCRPVGSRRCMLRMSTATQSGRYWSAGRCWSRSSAISRTMFAALTLVPVAGGIGVFSRHAQLPHVVTNSSSGGDQIGIR